MSRTKLAFQHLQRMAWPKPMAMYSICFTPSRLFLSVLYESSSSPCIVRPNTLRISFDRLVEGHLGTDEAGSADLALYCQDCCRCSHGALQAPTITGELINVLATSVKATSQGFAFSIENLNGPAMKLFGFLTAHGKEKYGDS
ncbi:hypothetical protein DM01DRAFT_1403312 [Hesseltinella vesiculosa]|uniref:Uncharacterized protein n=1 Tax=Hesseltinella vesiculosa TaxID=101127 RepID=A0A1X2GXS5_9FUNG|nr:hypothetical protein DM01DRAFT_1403312 [Hesseltinella vesiculosa]